MNNARNFHLELQIRRIDLLYRQSLTAPGILGIVAAIFGYFAWPSVPQPLLISWLVFIGIAAFTRLWGSFRWWRNKDSITSVAKLNRWHAYLAASILLSGIALGIMGWLTAQYLTGVIALCFGLVILGIVAGSTASYAPSLLSTLAIIIPATSIWGIGCLYLGGRDHVVTGFMILFYMVVLIRIAFNWYGYMQKSMLQTLDLHEKEERLRHNRDASGAADWEWNLRTDAFFCEGQLEHLFGVDSTFFRGDLRSYLNKVLPADRSSLELAMTAAIQSGSLDAEHRVKWPDGQTQYIAFRGRVQYDEMHKPIRMTGICWNITAKKVEEQLRHERDLYEAADRAKLVFLANASHEIRTPLSAINGFAELVLSRRDLNAEIIDDVNVILRNGKYLAAIVNDLLDLSKSEADHLYIQKSTMSPVREINDSLLVVKAAAKQKGLWIKTVYETPIPETIYSDATRFRQILINLLTNAVKYTNEGGATVYVSYQSKDKNSFLRLVISDTGIGINEETRKGLFQPFMRGQNSEVQRVSGSGLGLALSRNLARKMGGDLKLLNLDTTTLESSFFELTLDTGSLEGVRLIKGEDYSTGPVEISTEQMGPPRLQGKKILLVEDQADLRELMQRYLEKNGARLVICNNGADAVEQAMQAEYDAILMDIQMPIMDGYQATQTLRQRGYSKAVVALTAHASTADREKCYKAGCDFYLSKPVNTSHLLDLLTRQIDSSESRIN